MNGSGTGTTPLRVVEVSRGISGAYCGWLLGGMGAEVDLLDLSDGAGGETSPVSLALDHLHVGKRTCEALDAALDGAALLICDDVRELERLVGEPLSSLARRRPELVLAVTSVFGLEGPLADVPASELDAQAISSVAWSLGEAGRTPLTVPTEILAAQAGGHLAAAALMALQTPPGAGGARIIDVALADVLASYVGVNCRFYIHHGMSWERSGRRASGSGGAYPFVILPCKDGQVCLSGRTRGEWDRLTKALGSPEWASDPRYQSLRKMGREYPEEVDALLLPILAEMTKAEIGRLANEHKLTISPLRTIDEVLATPQFASRNFFRTVRIADREVRAPNLPFHFSGHRAENAPDRSEMLLAAAPKRSGNGNALDPARPLAGLKVVDLGWVWSAPQVSGILAQFGAEVIKVENGGRIDNMRLSGRVYRDGEAVPGDPVNMSPMFHQINRGKQGVTLNLKEPAAVELLTDLIRRADVVIENMSPGSLERAGLGYEDIRRIRPDIVMLSMSGAGQFGALAQMRTYAPVMSSFAGLETLIGYQGEGPIGALNFALGDPNAAMHGLVALFAALLRRQATREGGYIDLSQTESLLATLTPFILQAQTTGEQPAPRGNRDPRHAPSGIFPAAGSDNWISLSVETDEHWRALVALADGAHWSADESLATREGRLARAGALEREIACWTAGFNAGELSGLLRNAGVPATPVSRIGDLWEHPHFKARQMIDPVDLPDLGPVPMFRPPWLFSDLDPPAAARGPRLGEHNQTVFGGLLGIDPQRLRELEQSGTIA